MNESFAPDASVTEVALRHNMNTNVIFRWRKQFREGLLCPGTVAGEALPPPQFVPIRVVPDAPAMLPAPQTHQLPAAPAERPAPCLSSGIMELTLPGGFTLRLDADVDDRALHRVLQALREHQR